MDDLSALAAVYVGHPNYQIQYATISEALTEIMAVVAVHTF